MAVMCANTIHGKYVADKFQYQKTVRGLEAVLFQQITTNDISTDNSQITNRS
jgi:hypothetical protein